MVLCLQEPQEGKRAAAANMAAWLRQGLPAEVTLHGDFQRGGQLPFQDAVCIGTLDGKGGPGVIIEQCLQDLSIRSEATRSGPPKIGCCSDLGVLGMQAQVGFNDEGRHQTTTQ